MSFVCKCVDCGVPCYVGVVGWKDQVNELSVTRWISEIPNLFGCWLVERSASYMVWTEQFTDLVSSVTFNEVVTYLTSMGFMF